MMVAPRPQARVDVSTADKVAACLRGCSSRVDVILDPSHSQLWYPYWEGRRKMAPQVGRKASRWPN